MRSRRVGREVVAEAEAVAAEVGVAVAEEPVVVADAAALQPRIRSGRGV
jgi:hypothetical protein